MDTSALDYVVTECKALLDTRFPDGSEHGAAAMLLEDGTVVTGTAPDMPNAAVEVCHEIEPYCAAHRLDLRVVASVCLHRRADGSVVVLSPCGVCRERLAAYGPDVLAAVAGRDDPTVLVWKRLADLMPDYWLTALTDDVHPGWLR